MQIELLEPQGIRSLILISPSGRGRVSQEMRAVLAPAADTMRSHGLRAGIEVTLRGLMLCQPARADLHAPDLLEYCVRNMRFIWLVAYRLLQHEFEAVISKPYP